MVTGFLSSTLIRMRSQETTHVKDPAINLANSVSLASAGSWD